MVNTEINRGGAATGEQMPPSEFKRDPNTQYVLSLSYGKDSVACLGAIEELGLPLDRVITAEVWATDTIQADLPPMIEFKDKVDKYIKDRYGITVEHVYATVDGGACSVSKNSSTKLDREKLEANQYTDSPLEEDSGAHLSLSQKCSTDSQKLTYEKMFYYVPKRKPSAPEKRKGAIRGFPIHMIPWCKALKVQALAKAAFL